MNKTPAYKIGIRWRTIISLTTTWMFLVMGITGLVLYVVPQGRIAYWVDWRFLGLSKTDWGDIHIVAAILFLIAGGWHIYFNWKALLGHLRRKLEGGIKMRKELLITTALTGFVAASALWHVPPLGYLIDLNEAIKNSWIESEEFEPPFGHAELLSLKGFCKKTNIDVSRALAKLEAENIRVESTDETLESIASNNDVSPKDIFGMIKDFRRGPVSGEDKARKLSPDDVFERFEGTGIGRKTVSEACAMAEEELSKCLERLKRREIPVDLDATLKSTADRAGLRPIQVLQTMLVDQ